MDDGSAGGSATFQTKIALADQAGEGWPDVVFSTQNNDASWASKETNGVQALAAPLNKGKQLLDEFGYDIPTTWEDYIALSDSLAADHPGYFLGSVGDAFTGTYVYYWFLVTGMTAGGTKE